MECHEGVEKRRVPRRVLASPCPVRFAIDGEVHAALLVDVSWRGARFKETGAWPLSATRFNDILEVMVTAPMGTGPCWGRVAFVAQVDGQPAWGFDFISRCAEVETLLGDLPQASHAAG